MKTLYLECAMGAAGDMLMAALLELIDDREGFLRTMNALGLPGVRVTAEAAAKCGIQGTHVRVMVDGQEEESLDAGDSPAHSGGGRPHGRRIASIKGRPQALARDGAHEHSHGHVHEHGGDAHHGHSHGHAHPHDHSHERGDYVYWHPLKEEHDHGHEHDSHHGHAHEHPHGEDSPHGHSHGHAHPHEHRGMREVEEALSGLPLSEGVRANALGVYKKIAEAESHAHGVPVEQIHFHEVGNLDAIADIVGVCLLMEMLSPEKVIASPVHVGSGHVRCAHGVLPVPAPATAYLLRGIPIYGGAVRGELCTPTGAALLAHFAGSFGPMPPMAASAIGYGMGTKDFPQANCVRAFWGETQAEDGDVLELLCNLDDMTPEAVAFAQQALLDAGALDVYTTAIGMKKGRPGVLLTVMCAQDGRQRMLELLFRHTTTLGVRVYRAQRHVLTREIHEVDTPCGTVRVKAASGYGVHRCKLEYEDLARIARERGCSLAEAERAAKAAKKETQ